MRPGGEYLHYLWRCGGIGAACKIRGISSDIKILILTMHSALQLDLIASIPINSSTKLHWTAARQPKLASAAEQVAEKYSSEPSGVKTPEERQTLCRA